MLGRSGSGKTTLALNLVGVYPDYFGGRNEGRVLIDHATKGLINRRELDRGERFATVNMLFQNPEEQIVTLTVEEEIGFALENYLFPRTRSTGASTGARHRRLDRLPGTVDVKLSGGEKQRVALGGDARDGTHGC